MRHAAGDGNQQQQADPELGLAHAITDSNVLQEGGGNDRGSGAANLGAENGAADKSGQHAGRNKTHSQWRAPAAAHQDGGRHEGGFDDHAHAGAVVVAVGHWANKRKDGVRNNHCTGDVEIPAGGRIQADPAQRCADQACDAEWQQRGRLHSGRGIARVATIDEASIDANKGAGVRASALDEGPRRWLHFVWFGSALSKANQERP